MLPRVQILVAQSIESLGEQTPHLTHQSQQSPNKNNTKSNGEGTRIEAEGMVDHMGFRHQARWLNSTAMSRRS